MTDDQIVYVSPICRTQPRGPYHTDPDCPHITDGHVQKELAVVSSDRRECKTCAGETHGATEQRPSLRQQLADRGESREYVIKTARTRRVRVAHKRDDDADNGVVCSSLPDHSAQWLLTRADVERRGLRICQHCDGTWTPPSESDWGAYNAAIEAGRGER